MPAYHNGPQRVTLAGLDRRLCESGARSRTLPKRSHVGRADRLGNGQYLGPDPYFDDLFCEAADAAYLSCERIVDTAELTKEAAPQTLLVKRHTVTGVVEAPNGAHFTSCAPDYARDEAFQKTYATTPWPEFAARFLSGDEQAYQSAVGEES